MNVAAMARVVAEQGDGTDKILAHVTRRAAVRLMKRFGGNVNAKTGLPQFDFWSNLKDSVGGLVGFGGNSASPGNTAYGELQTAAQPLIDTGKQDLTQYQSNTLKPADSIALGASTAANKAGLKQFYANAGLGDSSMLENQLGNVNNQEVGTRQKLVDSYLQSALQAYGTAFQPLSQAISYQFQGNQQTQANLSSLIGNIFGSNGMGTESLSGIGSWFSGLFGGGGAAADAADSGWGL